jgi:hypothetical protein
MFHAATVDPMDYLVKPLKMCRYRSYSGDTDEEGIATPKQEIGLVKKRLAWAKEISAQSLEQNES